MQIYIGNIFSPQRTAKLEGTSTFFSDLSSVSVIKRHGKRHEIVLFSSKSGEKKISKESLFLHIYIFGFFS